MFLQDTNHSTQDYQIYSITVPLGTSVIMDGGFDDDDS